MNANEYFNRMIDFREDTSLYLKEVLHQLDTYKGLSFHEKCSKNFTPQFYDGRLIRNALEWKGCNLAVNHFNQKPFVLSIKTIKKVHTMVFKYCAGCERKGQFIHTPNNLTFPLKTGGVIQIVTSLPGEVNTHMNRLINWTNTQLLERKIHPLIIIGLFKYEFGSIHPFDNGNGRTSRILTSLLLRSAGYKFITYIDFERAVNNSRALYCGTLADALLKRGTPNEKIDAWMLYFVSGLQHIIKSKRINTSLFNIALPLRAR